MTLRRPAELAEAGIVEAGRVAALELVAARYLLEEDVELSVTLAARTWDWLA